MPQYDFRCKNCKETFSVFYKTYADYDDATPQCPNCAHTELSRLITSIAIHKPSRDYAKMSSNEMLSVLESGDSQQVGQMFEQVGGGDPSMGAEYHDTTKKLLDKQNKSEPAKPQSKASTDSP